MSTTGSGNWHPHNYIMCSKCGKKGCYKSGYAANDEEFVKYEKCRYCDYVKEL